MSFALTNIMAPDAPVGNIELPKEVTQWAGRLVGKALTYLPEGLADSVLNKFRPVKQEEQGKPSQVTRTIVLETPQIPEAQGDDVTQIAESPEDSNAPTVINSSKQEGNASKGSGVESFPSNSFLEKRAENDKDADSQADTYLLLNQENDSFGQTQAPDDFRSADKDESDYIVIENESTIVKTEETDPPGRESW